ncbi:hypothetical protein MMC28_008780 [Mycoblastus sanguinarius]|nr:hypothetical protein [Mycoblastus sanguinarius]
MDCQRLDIFLANPRERVGRFALAQKRREHIHSQLDGTGCTHETERQGSPFTLVVTKTQKEWHKSYKAWQERCLVATQSFQTIGMQPLEEILGERYRELVGLSAVKLGPVASGSSKPATDGPTGVPPRSASMSAWHAAKAEEARKRMPLETVSQPNSNGNQTAPVTGQRVKPGSKVEIIDLT